MQGRSPRWDHVRGFFIQFIDGEKIEIVIVVGGNVGIITG